MRNKSIVVFPNGKLIPCKMGKTEAIRNPRKTADVIDVRGVRPIFVTNGVGYRMALDTPRGTYPGDVTIYNGEPCIVAGIL